MSEGYALPNAESMPTTPEGAAAEIDRVFAEVVQDKNHPYCDGHHGLHKRYAEHMAAMFVLKADGDTRTPMQRTIDSVCEEAMAAQVEKQNKLVKEAEAEMAKLVALGFDDDEIPDDLQEYELNDLRMQRLHAQKNYEQLTPLIEKQLQTLKVPADIQGLFAGLNRANNVDEQLKQDIVEKVIFWIHTANKQKFGHKAKASAETE